VAGSITLRKMSRRNSEYLSSTVSDTLSFNTAMRQSLKAPESSRPPVRPRLDSSQHLPIGQVTIGRNTYPPKGLHTCAASPARRTRPSRNVVLQRWWIRYGENIFKSYFSGRGPGRSASYFIGNRARNSSVVNLPSSPYDTRQRPSLFNFAMTAKWSGCLRGD
jgi:hypothetical protein